MNEEGDARGDTVAVNGITLPDVHVYMIRPSLADIDPHAPLLDVQPSPNYELRSYRPGDEAAWLRIQKAAEPFLTIGDDLFQRQFGEHPRALPERMFFLEHIDNRDRRTPVGTASAWWKDDWKGRGPWGQVHWVAILPEHQGLGLAKVLMDRVMKRLIQSHQRAMLGTSTGRVRAIKVYLDCGFQPDPNELTNPKISSAWQQVQQVLRHPALALE